MLRFARPPFCVFSIIKERNTKKDESNHPPCDVVCVIWRSFSGAAYWAVCNSCLRVASPLAKPASTQSLCFYVLGTASKRKTMLRFARPPFTFWVLCPKIMITICVNLLRFASCFKFWEMLRFAALQASFRLSPQHALPLPGRKYWFHLLCMFL